MGMNGEGNLNVFSLKNQIWSYWNNALNGGEKPEPLVENT